ncbi:NADP-dependent oxidoreductase domain-containing protein [Microdochium trichocladiopsis]|uniref:NADP-dependent oxidoreductase domain-containing protein n=1 Tax=Microdochium trichocladiopsis TaxID=1682393 RepID=A0A9P8Y2D2_9PEZI|nr:NADP-dependent oxidoreductase domain-containing protein [Microdochium trichocladiopsis]KAH7029174.1 NADP-dependent oxidoreductase domain-containing protein [Microdochium trichocladiopsis]
MAAQRAVTDNLTLASKQRIPQLGFGVYKSPADQTVASCRRALDVGYRHIDTAQFYGNEREVGDAVRQHTSLKRSDVFLTTKILEAGGSVDASYAKCVESVRKLNPGVEQGGGGYVDLFLIHTSNVSAGQRKEMWQALERLYEEGKARSIGVSNFGIKHIEELKQFAKVWPPHANQIELHPWHQQREIVKYCEDNKIIVQAYCPIARNKRADDKTVAGVAHKHGVTANQVLIRWSLQKGWVPLPKSDDPERIRLNADVYGFELDNNEMQALDALDEGAAGALVKTVENH